jgi:hypothetical protein
MSTKFLSFEIDLQAKRLVGGRTRGVRRIGSSSVIAIVVMVVIVSVW